MAVRRILVAVSPRLLGDALCRALAQDGHDVASADLAGLAAQTYDVAVVSPGRGGEVRADHVITLPEQSSGTGGLSSLALLQHALADLR